MNLVVNLFAILVLNAILIVVDVVVMTRSMKLRARIVTGMATTVNLDKYTHQQLHQPPPKNLSSQFAYHPQPNHRVSPKSSQRLPPAHPPPLLPHFLPHLLHLRDVIGYLGHNMTTRHRFRGLYRGDSGYLQSCQVALADNT